MESALYPEIEPYRSDVLTVGSEHRLWFEECGTAEGLPAVFLHGGPGSACQPGHRRLFDPGRYRAILYDQRGAGRSRPRGETRDNTSSELVADLERLREALQVDQWVVCGGSWGAALALLYAQHHPDRVVALVLRGVFLARPKDLEWFVGPNGVARLFPEAYGRFREAVDPGGDIVAAYQRALQGTDQGRAVAAARAWSAWESAVLSPAAADPPASQSQAAAGPAAAVVQRARIAAHYAANSFFLGGSGVLRSPERLRGLPGLIVHGRLDLLTPAENAVTLTKAWPEAELRLIPAGGHTLGDEAIATGVRQALDEVTERFGA
jgi:proline iminopeptidase